MTSRIAQIVRDLLSSFTLSRRNSRYQLLEFLDRCSHLQGRQPPFCINHPVVPLRQAIYRRFPEAKGFFQQPLGAISLNGISQCLAGSGDAESVVSQVVRQDKRGHQSAFITLALTIDLLEFVAAAQIRRHALNDILIVSRGQTPSSLCAPSFKNKSAGLRRHSCSEPMRFSSTPIVGLKSSLRHRWKIPRQKKTVRVAVTRPSVKKGALLSQATLLPTSSPVERPFQIRGRELRSHFKKRRAPVLRAPARVSEGQFHVRLS